MVITTLIIHIVCNCVYYVHAVCMCVFMYKAVGVHADTENLLTCFKIIQTTMVKKTLTWFKIIQMSYS